MFTLLTAIAIAIFIQPSPGNPELLVELDESKLEALGHGYSREGDFIYFDKQRIDQARKEDFAKFAKSTNLKLRQCTDVDAASFKALSEEYTKDRNKVYYKWFSSNRFWVVELPLAHAKSFEVISSNLAKDEKYVWWYGVPLRGIDPKTVEVVNPGFVWKDAKNVWYQRSKIAGADVKTFRHLEQAFYRDASRVYWSSTALKGADPETFRTFGEESPYGADRNSVWRGETKITGYDAASFQPIHQSVCKDQNGVYAGGHLLDKADTNSFRKVAVLDASLSALLADEHQYYLFLPLYGDVYRVTSTGDPLNVERSIWPPGIHQKGSFKADPVAIATADLAESGWKNLNIAAGPAIDSTLLRAQETSLLNLHTAQFAKAWEIIRDTKGLSKSISEDWQSEIPALEGELAGKALVPDRPSLEKRATIQPAPDVTAIAKDLLRACLTYDEKKLNELYASEVQLLPGNRLFYFGLEVPGQMTEFGVPVDRDEILVAIKKQADGNPFPSFIVGTIVNTFQIEQLDVGVGEFATEPNQPGEVYFRELHFKIEENDVLLKLSVPSAFRFVQLRKADEGWKVVAEY